MSASIILEACVESLEDAVVAAGNGAHRLELCTRLDLDGLTPPLELVRAVRNAVSIPVKPMVRPREGDFVYDGAEFDSMLKSIEAFKDVGVREIATGVLLHDNRLDLKRITQLAKAAAPMHLTIHKCIDLVPDMEEAINLLKQIPGVTHILSSGQVATAWEGRETLERLVQLCAQELTLIVAGKVTHDNLEIHIAEIKATEYHGKRIVS